MKHRLERVNELLKRELGTAMSRGLTFAGALVTVHAVEVSPDLKNADVYISVIGNGAQVAWLWYRARGTLRELFHRDAAA